MSDFQSLDYSLPYQLSPISTPKHVNTNKYPIQDMVITTKRSDSPDFVAACCKETLLRVKLPIITGNSCICVNMLQYSRVMKMKLKGWKPKRLRKPDHNMGIRHQIAKVRNRSSNGKFAAGCIAKDKIK